MINSDLVTIFKSLTIKEIKRLPAFIDSPIANKIRYRSEVQILLKILQNHAHTGSEVNLKKEKVYKQVFPGKDIVSGLIERVMFELSQVIRLFLITEHYLDEKNMLNMQLDYAEILRSRGVTAKAQLIVNQTLEDIEKIPIKAPRDYAKAFEASLMANIMASQKNRWKDDLQIAKTLKYLDLYYASNRLELINNYLLISKVSKLDQSDESDPLNTEFILPVISIEEAPILFISHKIYQLLSNEHPTQDGFEDLLVLLNTYESQIDEETIKSFFGYLRNYCTILINYGYFELFPVLHQIHKENLVKGYFLYQDKIPAGAYTSIVNAALRAKKEDWALHFIEEYKNQILESTDSSELYNLNMANYYFHIGNFDQALDFLPPTSDNLERHLIGRRLELKIYFEMTSELLIYKLEAFKMYIRRASQKLISENNRERHANFANLLHQLVLTQPGDQERAKRILDRIEEKKQVAEKEWLLEQAKKWIKK